MEHPNLLDLLLNHPETEGLAVWLSGPHKSDSESDEDSSTDIPICRDGKKTLEGMEIKENTRQGIYTKEGGEKAEVVISWLEKKGRTLEFGPGSVDLGGTEIDIMSGSSPEHFKKMAELCANGDNKDDEARIKSVEAYMKKNNVTANEILLGTTTSAIVDATLGIKHVVALGKALNLSENFQAILAWSESDSDVVKGLAKTLQDGAKLYSPSSGQVLFHLTVPLMLARRSLQAIATNGMDRATTFIEALVEFCVQTGHLDAMVAHFNKDNAPKKKSGAGSTMTKKKAAKRKTNSSPATSTNVNQRRANITPPTDLNEEGFVINEEENSITYLWNVKDMEEAA
jgi:hypothetical protein